MRKQVLSAVVQVNRLTANIFFKPYPKGHKLKGATEVVVLYGKQTLGKCVLGGDWSREQALAEFRKNPARFGWAEQGVSKPIPQPVTSNIDIFMGPYPVARLMTFSEMTPERALSFFQESPQLFNLCYGYEKAKQEGLIAA